MSAASGFVVSPSMHVGGSISGACATPFAVAGHQVDFAREVREHLHRYPETRYETEKTTRFLVDHVRRMIESKPAGLKARIVGEGEAGGFWLDIDHPWAETKGRLALVADFDALPIAGNEDTGLPFASTRPGLMHACAHDVHAAALLGFARAVLTGEVVTTRALRLVFQDAEENIGTGPRPESGAQLLIKRGVLEGVSAAAKWHAEHPFGSPGIQVGAGAMLGNTDRIVFDFRDGNPDERILGQAAIIAGVDHLFERYPRYGDDDQLISVEPILLGGAGTPHNVIPQHAGFRLELRGDQSDEKVVAAVEGAASAVRDAFPGSTINIQREEYLLTISITGKAGHVMMPQMSLNALRVQAHLLMAIRDRIEESGAGDFPAILGQFGGLGAGATISPESSLLISVRTFFGPEDEEGLLSRIEGAAMGLVEDKLELIYNRLPGTPAPISDEHLASSAAEAFRRAGLTVAQAIKLLAGDDFGFCTTRVPSLFFTITGAGDRKVAAPPHSNRFNPDPDLLQYGIAAWLLLSGAGL